ncbi:cytochrome P450 [Streptomyces sp. SRF1]|uniref:cytochrome P450 n=1 Tax=Streptomyces sp. SRF1 TaxID=1549642 RepID=UPI00339D728D
MLSALVRTSDEDGDRLCTDELAGMGYLLLAAGYETTVGLLSGGTCALLRHPDQLSAVRADFRLLEGAVEEILRYEAPAEHATYRCPTEDVAFQDGTVVPAGESVVVHLPPRAVTRSASTVPTPSTPAATPRGTSPSGTARATARARRAARLEGRTALRALLERAPGLALDTAPDRLSRRERPDRLEP